MKQFKLGPLQKKWIKYLKEHPEQQLKSQLGKKEKNNIGLCCLGAAGLILNTCVWEKNIDSIELIEKKTHATGNLPETYKKMGLRDRYGRISGTNDSLTILNDDEDNTWIDIAYMLENNPEDFFTKSI